MIEKDIAINILEDIQQCLNEKNWQNKILSTVKQYKKGLLISIDQELKDLIVKYNQYDKNSIEAIELSKMIDKKLEKIYNG